MSDPRALTLIGMPACGKSTVGHILAQHLGWDFVDTDDLLTQWVGKPLPVFLETYGPERFRQEEESTILSMDVTHPAVVATGGSVIYSPAAMEYLATLGPVVYIELTPEEVEARLMKAPHRALAIPEGQTWDELMKERMTLYSRYATHTVHSEGTPDDMAEKVLMILNTY